MTLGDAQARALLEHAVAALQRGDAASARTAFAQLVLAGRDDASVHVGMAYACRALGDDKAVQAAIDRALELDPRNVRALLLKAESLQAQGNDRAVSYYNAALKCVPSGADLPPDLEQAIARAQGQVAQYSQRFEQVVRAHVAEAVREHGHPPPRFEQSLEVLSGRRTIYPQAPLLYHYPELPTVQFFGREGFPWLQALEAATAQIRAEALEVLADPRALQPYLRSDPTRPILNRGGMLDNPQWSAFYLWKDGAPVDAHAKRCPHTMRALAEVVPLVHTPRRSPSVLFSVLRPGAHIPPHNGFVNTRLIGHLPLVVPPGCSFRVGNETREWQEGRAWLFDDTIEHEAWNRSELSRVILLFEVWRPELGAAERAMVNAVFGAIDQLRGGVAEWGI